MRKRVVMSVICCVLVAAAVAAAGGDKGSWDMSGVVKIKLKGVSGDIVILPADGKKGMVELRSDVRPSDNFHVAVDRDGKTLNIKEKWDGNSSGSVRWTIYLPEKGDSPSIRISNASGNLECRDVATGIEYKTASGDVDLDGVELAEDSRFNTASGDFTIANMTVSEDTRFDTASGDITLDAVTIEEDCEFSTASGDVIIRDCKCDDDVSFSTASGDVTVKNSELLGENRFSSASGDVSVNLDRLPKSDMSASSASGKVTLDVEDFGKDFTLVLIKRKDRGRISCPFDYTAEEEFEDHHTYVRKIVKRGSGRPEITLKTASGKVVVKE